MRWRNLATHGVLLASLVSFFSCTKTAHKADSPEAVLEQYVKLAFSAKEIDDSAKLLELTTGAAREWLASMKKEDFDKQFVKNSMVFLDLKMKDKRQDQNGGVSIVYELSFRDGKGPEPLEKGMTPSPAAYSLKKIAYLSRDEKGDWKIKETKNVKTYVERKEDLVITPETTDKNPATESK